ncbi:MAG: ATP-grasp domain-containing protein [Desulfatiglandaceae bacterium]
MNAKKNVFVVGMDDFNQAKIKRLPEAGECEFFPAVKLSEMRGVENISIERLLEKVDARIKEVGRIDAVVSYYDFPGTVMVPIIATKYGLPGPSLESMLKCEHKFWSRIEQQMAIPDNIPQFTAFNPFEDAAFEKIDFITPYWIKPIKSYRSFLAYRINGPIQFREYMEEVREHIDMISEPFNYIFNAYGMPQEIAGMKETMIAETPISGHQCTVEGYAYNDEIIVYGIVDSIREEDRSSFSRYEYPSSLPQEIQFRMADLTRRAISRIGLMNSPFNIEFFYDATANQIYLLEINPRISQAHTDIFEKVHGISHHHIMLNLALNRRPKALDYKGDFRKAAHFMLRSFEPGIVKSPPTQNEIECLKKKYPDLAIKINVAEGTNLADMYGQDSYSYELANIHLGATNQEDLIAKYNDVVSNLSFDIDYGEQIHYIH